MFGFNGGRGGGGGRAWISLRTMLKLGSFCLWVSVSLILTLEFVARILTLVCVFLGGYVLMLVLRGCSPDDCAVYG